MAFQMYSGTNLESFYEPQKACLQQILHDARNAEFFSLTEHNFVIFKYISTKLCSKVCILLFNSCVQFLAKICMHC